MSCGTHLNFEVNFEKKMSSSYLKVLFLDDSSEAQICNNWKYKISPFAASEIFRTTIQSSQKLTGGPDVKTVYKVGFDLTGIQHKFVPGDTIGVHPSNNKTVIDQILLRLNLETVAESSCELQVRPETTRKNAAVPKHLPQKSNLRNIFLHHVDVHTPPKKMFLKSLIPWVQDSQEREKLSHICSAKGSQEYASLITSSGKTLLGLLETFSSCQPPVELLLENLPPLRPRPFSISSSPLSGKLEITFFVLERDDGTKGLCTEWLENLILRKNTDLVAFYFRQFNQFRLPDDPEIPLILVATGTGIAPFRAFLQHRLLKEECGDVWLFYGCRYSSRDCLFKNEINEYMMSGVLSRLNLSFSRESEQKRYVQHEIERNGEQFVNWVMEKSAKVFLCGDVKTVVKDVKNIILRLLIKYGGLSDIDADNYIREMESGGKLVIDSWI